MTAYFVAANGVQTGPFSLEQVKAQCSQGVIQRDTLMWREGLSDWLSAEQVLQGTGVSFSDHAPPPTYAASGSGAADDAYTVPYTSDIRFDVPAESLSAGSGTTWIIGGWDLFKAAPGMWIAAILIWLAIQVLISFIPFLGSIAGTLLGPSFTVGLLAFAHGIQKDGRTDLGELFAGFREKLGPLVIVGLLTFVMLLGIGLVGALLAISFLGGSAIFHSADPHQAIAAVLANGGVLFFLLGFLLMIAVMMLVFAAYLYAPGLVFFANQSPVDAMKHSFKACFTNWLPLLVYSLLGMLVMLLGALPFGLGLIVAIPMLSAANYVCFRDMFGRQD